jgi:hypothetical protein
VLVALRRGDSSGRRFYGVVDLVQFTYVIRFGVRSFRSIQGFKNDDRLWGIGP